MLDMELLLGVIAIALGVGELVFTVGERFLALPDKLSRYDDEGI